ncbi:MAG: AsmA-like C-terminal domain-containing protein [Desulfuromonadales bacterium]|nr:AsmA-like C-terminal domain-containing protein [Desulfuromonadales bacterium]
MKRIPFYRRYPLTCALLLLLVTTAVTLAVVLSHFDLARARQYLTQELSQILQQPVGIGKLNLTYQQGLAVEVHNIGIGDGRELDIRIPQLTGVLRLRPLLQGELLLDRVFLNEPQINLARSGATETLARGAVSSKTGDLFKRFGVSLLTIRHGRIDLSRDRLYPSRLPDRIDNLNLVLRGWQTERSGYLVVSGELPANQGKFTIETELPPPAQLAEWRHQPLRLKTDLKQVSRALLPAAIGDQLPARFDMAFSLKGSPASGTGFRIRASASDSGSSLLAAEGVWSSQEMTEHLQGLQVRLHDLPLQGQVLITRGADGTQLEGNLSGADIPLLPLLRKWSTSRTDRLLAGSIKTATVEFSGTFGAADDSGPGDLFRYQANAELEAGRLELSSREQLEGISLALQMDKQRLKITRGSAYWREQGLSFEGEVSNWRDTPSFTMRAAARPETAIVHQTFADSLPQQLTLNGTAPTTLTLEGKSNEIRGELKVDLDALQLQLHQLFDKQPHQQGKLQVSGEWRPGQVEIGSARLLLGDTAITATSAIPLGDHQKPLQLQFSGIDLLALQQFSPLLLKLKSRGKLVLDLDYSEATQISGELTLENAGAHLTSLIGDINSATGRISFDRAGLDFNQLAARIGNSPVQIDGSLQNWQNFLLDLRVKGQEIAARDLVFTNPDMVVFDLDGRLLINKGGIIFDPVQVQLENGTDATVSGYVRNFADPETYLEIDSSEHVDVLEIIKLFTGPAKIKSPRQKNAGHPVRILARAAQGTLGGLKFQQAEGLITVARGLFTLHPLTFRHQDGYCLARVEHERGRLKISGHLEDFDASTLYSEALHARGLVTGKLRGDFYLEGDGTGDAFWASSRGGAHLEIHNGALRKFRSLARVFSLLNISQLFELSLPDMDSKGMPFTLLKGSVSIKDGVISTENLNILSNAMNMSLVGHRNILEDTLDLTVGVKPLRTVDKIITAIPVAGWLLAGEEKALITAHFKVQGPADDPDVIAIPASSLSKTVLGIVQRTLGLPGKLISDPAKLFPQGAAPSLSPTGQDKNPLPKKMPATP